MKDYYYILGINKDASSENVKKAYKKLSLKLHPDQNNGDKFFEERFKEINEAYETLIDVSKRNNYDLNFINPNYNVSSTESAKNDSDSQKKNADKKRKGAYTKQDENRSASRQNTKSNVRIKKSLFFVLGIVVFIFILKKTIIEKSTDSNSFEQYNQDFLKKIESKH